MIGFFSIGSIGMSGPEYVATLLSHQLHVYYILFTLEVTIIDNLTDVSYIIIATRIHVFSFIVLFDRCYGWFIDFFGCLFCFRISVSFLKWKLYRRYEILENIILLSTMNVAFKLVGRWLNFNVRRELMMDGFEGEWQRYTKLVCLYELQISHKRCFEF